MSLPQSWLRGNVGHLWEQGGQGKGLESREQSSSSEQLSLISKAKGPSKRFTSFISFNPAALFSNNYGHFIGEKTGLVM